jgi:tRNA isopentenyl-2-thiomethyl-A-37 hydroxylase MiaE
MLFGKIKIKKIKVELWKKYSTSLRLVFRIKNIGKEELKNFINR